jgi:hypothetical protein
MKWLNRNSFSFWHNAQSPSIKLERSLKNRLIQTRDVSAKLVRPCRSMQWQAQADANAKDKIE